MPGQRNLADRIRPFRRWAGFVESAEVRLFGVSMLSLIFRQRVLVLETTGRRSGRRRQTTVAYRIIDGEHIVVGGAGGQTAVPDWVANLRANPDVVAVRRLRRTPMVAVVLADPERQVMWQRLSSDWSIISRYQEKAGRPIPVIRLVPRAGTPSDSAAYTW